MLKKLSKYQSLLTIVVLVLLVITFLKGYKIDITFIFSALVQSAINAVGYIIAARYVIKALDHIDKK